MLGDIEGGTRRHSVNCGMTPRVFEYLFSRIQKVCYEYIIHVENIKKLDIHHYCINLKLSNLMSQDKDARRDEKVKFTCRCSFIEIYNEQILDLLDPSSVNLQVLIMIL